MILGQYGQNIPFQTHYQLIADPVACGEMNKGYICSESELSNRKVSQQSYTYLGTISISACLRKCSDISAGNNLHVPGCCHSKSGNKCWWHPHSSPKSLNAPNNIKNKHFASDCTIPGNKFIHI